MRSFRSDGTCGGGGRDRVAVPDHLTSGGLPRIDYVDLEICKMPRVARGQRRTPRQRDSCDLGIADINGPASSLPPRGQFGGFDGRPGVEIQNAILEILFEQARKCRCERCAPLPVRKQSEPETGLEQSDAGDPDRFGSLSIQPPNVMVPFASCANSSSSPFTDWSASRSYSALAVYAP